MIGTLLASYHTKVEISDAYLYKCIYCREQRSSYVTYLYFAVNNRSIIDIKSWHERHLMIASAKAECTTLFSRQSHTKIIQERS
jgi:hypothetical protein